MRVSYKDFEKHKSLCLGEPTDPALKERKAIAAWLRANYEVVGQQPVDETADQIERGVHHEG
jgi:hypothetical protein